MYWLLFHSSGAHCHSVSLSKQRGVVTVVLALAMLALLAMMGLALDTGHIMINKTRLQNAVDAAALAAAKQLDDTENISLATSEAHLAFSHHAAAVGNAELAEAYQNGGGPLSIEVSYSATLPPFTAGAIKGPFVRVRATGFVVSTWLVHLVGVDQATLSASAVAGPRVLTALNNAVPLMVCGDPAAGSENHWGYVLNQVVVLKSSSTGCGSDVGSGNFQLLALGGTGGDVLKENLAGGFAQEVKAGSIQQTEPGDVVGPSKSGLNTRFGIYEGSLHGSEAVYPPDVIVDVQPSPGLSTQCVNNQQQVKLGSTVITSSNINLLYNFAGYTADLANPAAYDYQPRSSGGIGAYDRRMLAVPVGNCSATIGGRGPVPVLGFGCFWLLQPITNGGKGSYIYGEFVKDCVASGSAGSGTGNVDGPHIIQLYKNPAGTDS